MNIEFLQHLKESEDKVEFKKAQEDYNFDGGNRN